MFSHRYGMKCMRKLYKRNAQSTNKLMFVFATLGQQKKVHHSIAKFFLFGLCLCIIDWVQVKNFSTLHGKLLFCFIRLWAGHGKERSSALT